jgi:acetyl-CoA carboxylase / biotin carboxylase 1
LAIFTKHLQVESSVHNGHRKIEAVIGKENDIGVENLVGSGLIASETSAAYREVPTYCLVIWHSSLMNG